MPTSCCARLCAHNSRNCKLKTFPSDFKRARKWEANMRRPNWQRKNHHRICECHFEPNQFENKRLSADAVPTLFPTHKVTSNVLTRRKNTAESDGSASADMVNEDVLSENHFLLNADKNLAVDTSQDHSRDFSGTSAPTSPTPNLEDQDVSNESMVKSESDDYSNFDVSGPVSYLATTVMGGEETAKQEIDEDEEMLPSNKGLSPVTLSVPKHLLQFVTSPQNELKQESVECPTTGEGTLVRRKVQQLKSSKVQPGADTAVIGKLAVSECQVQDVKGAKVRCYAINQSGLNYLLGNGILPGSVTKKVKKDPACGEENGSLSNENDDSESNIESLQACLLAVESERDALQTANAKLIADKAWILNELHQLKADHKRSQKEIWKLQRLNEQLSYDNEKLIESLNAGGSSPNG